MKTDSDFGALRHAVRPRRQEVVAKRNPVENYVVHAWQCPEKAASRTAPSDRDAARWPQARIASAKTSSTGDQKATKMLRQIIQEYLIKQAGVSLSKFDDPDLMLADLGLDSLGVVEMLYEVEDRYGFQVQDPYRYTTMRFIDIVADLESTIRAKNNGELPEPKRTEA